MADQKRDWAVSFTVRTLGPVETELTRAIRDGRADLVKRLLEGGASPLDANNRDESPLLLGNYIHSLTDGALEQSRANSDLEATCGL